MTYRLRLGLFPGGGASRLNIDRGSIDRDGQDSGDDGEELSGEHHGAGWWFREFGRVEMEG